MNKETERKPSYTPGPWKADRVFIENAEDRMIVHSAKWGGENIADCGTFAGTNNNIANAALIASAPELLEALKEAEDTIRQYKEYGEAMREFGRGFQATGTRGDSIETIQSVISAAIAKAEGKE